MEGQNKNSFGYFSPQRKTNEFQTGHNNTQICHGFADTCLSEIDKFDQIEEKAESQTSNTLAKLLDGLEQHKMEDLFLNNTKIMKPQSQILKNQKPQTEREYLGIKRSSFHHEFQDFHSEMSFQVNCDTSLVQKKGKNGDSYLNQRDQLKDQRFIQAESDYKKMIDLSENQAQVLIKLRRIFSCQNQLQVFKSQILDRNSDLNDMAECFQQLDRKIQFQKSLSQMLAKFLSFRRLQTLLNKNESQRQKLCKQIQFLQKRVCLLFKKDKWIDAADKKTVVDENNNKKVIEQQDVAQQKNFLKKRLLEIGSSYNEKFKTLGGSSKRDQNMWDSKSNSKQKLLHNELKSLLSLGSVKSSKEQLPYSQETDLTIDKFTNRLKSILISPVNQQTKRKRPSVLTIQQFDLIRSNEANQKMLFQYKQNKIKLQKLKSPLINISQDQTKKPYTEPKYQKSLKSKEQIHKKGLNLDQKTKNLNPQSKTKTLLGLNRTTQTQFSQNLIIKNINVDRKEANKLKLLPENCKILNFFRDAYINEEEQKKSFVKSASFKTNSNNQLGQSSYRFHMSFNKGPAPKKNDKDLNEEFDDEKSENRLHRDFSPVSQNRITKSVNLVNLQDKNVSVFDSNDNHQKLTHSIRQPQQRRNAWHKNYVQNNVGTMHRTTRLQNTPSAQFQYTLLNVQDQLLARAKQIYMPEGQMSIADFYAQKIDHKIKEYVARNKNPDRLKPNQSLKKVLQNGSRLFYKNQPLRSIPSEQVLLQKTESEDDQMPRQIINQYGRQRQDSLSNEYQNLENQDQPNNPSKIQQMSSQVSRSGYLNNLTNKKLRKSPLEQYLSTFQNQIHQTTLEELFKTKSCKSNNLIAEKTINKVSIISNESSQPKEKNQKEKPQNIFKTAQNVLKSQNISKLQGEKSVKQSLTIKRVVSDDQSEQKQSVKQNKVPTFFTAQNSPPNKKQEINKPPQYKNTEKTNIFFKSSPPIQPKSNLNPAQATPKVDSNIFTQQKFSPDKNLFNQQQKPSFGQASNIFNKIQSGSNNTGQSLNNQPQFTSFNPNQFQNLFQGQNNQSFTNFQPVNPSLNPLQFAVNASMSTFESFGPAGLSNLLGMNNSQNQASQNQGPQLFTGKNPMDALNQQIQSNPNANLFAHQMNQITHQFPQNVPSQYLQARK